MKTVIDLNITPYNTLQEVIEAAEPGTILLLEEKTYDEGFIVNKPLVLKGNNTTFNLTNQQILVEDTVTFDGIDFYLNQTENDAHILVRKGALTCRSTGFIVGAQKKPLYAVFWVEESNLVLYEVKGSLEACLVKALNGRRLEINHSELTLISSSIAIEGHGMEEIHIMENRFTVTGHLFSTTKSQSIIIEENTILCNQPKKDYSAVVKVEKFEKVEMSSNQIESDYNIFVSINGGTGSDHGVMVQDNQFTCKHLLMDFANIPGALVLEKVDSRGDIHLNGIQSVVFKGNHFKNVKVTKVTSLTLEDSKITSHLDIRKCQNVMLKKNTFANKKHAREAVFLTGVEKLKMIQNKVSSVDHGVSFINAGDNLEIEILKNVFKNCRKRALNLISSEQKKFVKNDLLVEKNIFQKNDKALYIDDQNLKSLVVQESYFSENRHSILFMGGKATSHVKVVGNYFEDVMQIIELRGSRALSVLDNEFNDNKLVLRGCDDIVMRGNHLNGNRGHYHDVAIKSGGSLSVSGNYLPISRPRQEVKEVMAQLNITAYERNPSISIHDNYNMARGDYLAEEAAYPDASLLALLEYQIHTEHNLFELEIDEMLKQDFLRIREGFSDVKVDHAIINEHVQDILKDLTVEIFQHQDTNDIYRLIMKSKETIEMLNLYSRLENKTENTESRIVDILMTYKKILGEYLEKKVEDTEDMMNAQLSLMENLLK